MAHWTQRHTAHSGNAASWAHFAPPSLELNCQPWSKSGEKCGPICTHADAGELFRSSQSIPSSPGIGIGMKTQLSQNNLSVCWFADVELGCACYNKGDAINHEPFHWWTSYKLLVFNILPKVAFSFWTLEARHKLKRKNRWQFSSLGNQITSKERRTLVGEQSDWRGLSMCSTMLPTWQIAPNDFFRSKNFLHSLFVMKWELD